MSYDEEDLFDAFVAGFSASNNTSNAESFNYDRGEIESHLKDRFDDWKDLK